MKKIITIRENGTKRVQTINELPSKTDQSQKDDCDVNNIMAKFQRTGQITHLAKKSGTYYDSSEIPDLHQALQIVNEAGQNFSQLPAILRKKFNHDPQEFVKYLQDPSNDEEAIKLGLKKKKVASEPLVPSEPPKADKPKEDTDVSNT